MKVVHVEVDLGGFPEGREVSAGVSPARAFGVDKLLRVEVYVAGVIDLSHDGPAELLVNDVFLVSHSRRFGSMRFTGSLRYWRILTRISFCTGTDR